MVGAGARRRMTGPFAPRVDMHSVGVLDDPYPLYRRLRLAVGLCRSAEGHWLLANHADVRSALIDHGTYSSADTNGATRRSLRVLVGTDPPEHTRLRRVAGRLFSPSARAGWLEAALERIDEIVAGAVKTRRIEAVAGLCQPVGLAVVGALLGIPEEGLGRLIDESVTSRRMHRRSHLAGFFLEHLEAVTAPHLPGAALSVLLEPDSRGEAMTRDEIVAFCVLLLAAGIDSPRDALANLLILGEDGHLTGRLYTHPEMMDSTVEEALRYVSPVQAVFRTVRRDACVRGTTIPAGDRVVLLLGSANRDEQVWRHADQFVPERFATSAPPHLGLGWGPHLCIGGAVARLQLAVTLEALAQARVGWRVCGPVARGRSPYFRAVRRLDLELGV